MATKDRITCGRCGEYKPKAREGPYAGMLCEDCALAKEYEAAVEAEGGHA